MRKSLWSLVSLLVVTSLVLVACATPTTQAPAATDAPEATTAPEATDAPEPTTEPSGEKVQIRWFVGLGTGTNPEQVAAQEEVVADFNASQDGIELVLEIVPFDSARDTLSTQIASGSGPDIIGPVGWGGSNAFYGQWLDLTPYIEATSFDTSVYDPALVEFYQTEEGQVGLPFAVFPAATYYVPAMFDEAGLNYPPAAYGDPYVMPDGTEVDWNWDTLAEIARILTVDANGNDATSPDFDRENIVQLGYSPQWQTHVNYQASYIAGAADIVEGDAPGSYAAAFPDSWKAANQWIYDAMWGEQPFVATGPLSAAPEFGGGNTFNSGKAAMAITPIWYTCCLSDFAAAGNEWQAGVMPMGADGEVHSRVDADTFRIWKGTEHPEEAFTVLSYLIGDGGDKLLPAYGAMPAIASKTQAFFDTKTEQYPFVTPETWAAFQAGLAYPDAPSAEQWQPNWNEAWAREQTFFDLLLNTPPDQLDFDAEWQKMIDDVNVIYNK
jgi:multiple sugar transport system substrate-binding protein